MDRSLPPGVVPVDRSARIGALLKDRNLGLCPFDDPKSRWYSPAPAPEGTEEWWLE